jgi:hypothetical protein
MNKFVEKECPGIAEGARLAGVEQDKRAGAITYIMAMVAWLSSELSPRTHFVRTTLRAPVESFWVLTSLTMSSRHH